MENSKKQIVFRAIYSKKFGEKAWVQDVISKWQEGAESFVLTTSGSTGLPKQITLNREVLQWSANATKSSFGLQNERIFCCLPTTKAGGFMQIIRALCFDWEIYFETPSTNPFLDLGDNTFTLVSLTPMQLSAILDSCDHKLAAFRNVLIGGAAISIHLAEKIAEYSAKNSQTTFWETYGMTETASHVALRNISKGEMYFTPQIGVKIGAEDGRLVLEIGECGIHETTNDLVEISSQGFKVLGRADNVINSGGLKIHPELLEPVLEIILQSAGITRQFYLTGESDDVLGQKLILVMEGAPLADERFVLELLKRELPQYHNPKKIRYVEKILLTSTGKIVRKVV